MNYCEVKNSQRGQTLKKMSGLSEFSSYSFIRGFEEENGRMPELDEIPEANSEPYLRDKLKIKKEGNSEYVSIQDILKLTNSKSIEEATSKINNEYKDLEVHFTQIGDSVLIDIKHRPTEYTDVLEINRDIDFDESNNSIIIEDALDRLQKYYGINMIPITSEQLSSDPEFQNLPVHQLEAFIYNGNIYINTDIATVDAPIHEQLHLFLGSIRYNNPDLYFSLVSQVQQLPNFELQAKSYPNRTMSDIQEEIFVKELAKFLTNQPSLFDSADKNIMNYVIYNIKRDIDSIIFGEVSVKTIDNLFQNSLLNLASRLNSSNFDVDSAGTIDDATIHRIMSNVKEELLTNNELIENCI